MTTLNVRDRLDIADLYSRWCVAIDDGDSRGWAATFTDDGLFRLEEPAMHVEGSADLVELASRVYEHDQGLNRHLHHNLVIVGDSASGVARGRADMEVLELRGGGDARIIKTARYRDVLVRTANGWCFKERAQIWDTTHVPVQPGVDAEEFFS